jgi:hypothetical protein
MLKLALGVATAGTVGFFIGMRVSSQAIAADANYRHEIRRQFMCKHSLLTCPAPYIDYMSLSPMEDESDFALEELNKTHPDLLFAIASENYAFEFVDKTKTPLPVVQVPCEMPIKPWYV